MVIRDFSISAVAAGFVAVLIGFASSVAIVFQAAVASGANPSQIESWIWALGIGMGVSTFGLSLYYKNPIIVAWSTPGAALLATSLQGESLAQTTGTFLFVGLLIFIVGLTGLFRRINQFIPMPIAAAMLAGILFQFGISIFTSLGSAPYLITSMILAYLAMRYFFPRYAILFVLFVGTTFCIADSSLLLSDISLSFANPVWVKPEFSFASIVGIGIPLFIVTMASQNLPGAAVLKSSGYTKQNVSPVISVTGLGTLMLAPFGGFTFNLAAITAAICTSDECHPEPKKRYISGLSAGVFNILAGLFGATVVSLFAAFPAPMIAALAGLALLSTIAHSLQTALGNDSQKEAALITFLVTASGLSLFGVASAFWGVVIGLIVLTLSRKTQAVSMPKTKGEKQ